mmetsp:Transcript_11281/g.19266  ORF Transcript_11281/g.19266 Transcript_11281/m.19266 type:complete len:575 (-) Transcript_11281:122-1846(-)|eukprot:CAMPEP_0184699308 /NCGR_PEP_ID=MMETSP0313-20130426/5627_1 /TAXON_ID=2792 /ORGANISM="Porphyridium aerugineum, Strain SAG 1380-2" /LENGTH=574 /DNA_ID=CAMNT_0027158379 /DNA_START=290 /DNA_END=2014 /DNA_ORIENTATION=-
MMDTVVDTKHINAKKDDANVAFKEKKYHLADDLYTEAIDMLEVLMKSSMSSLSTTPDSNGGVGVDVASYGAGSGTDMLKTPTGVEASVSPNLVELETILLCNRSFTRLKREEYGYAIHDASLAIEKNPDYVKAYYRRGCAKMAIGKYKEALTDFKEVAKRHNDKDIQAKLKDCEKRVKEEAFAKAIAGDELQIRVSNTIDLEIYKVDDSYVGLKLPDDFPVPKPGAASPGQISKAKAGEASMDVSPLASAPKSLLSPDFALELMKTFKDQKKIHIRYALLMLLEVNRMFAELPNIVYLPIDGGKQITVCGDTHGQFYDLLNIFELNGMPSESNPYLFNGDFVDRGSFSLEVIMTLLAWKLVNPNCMHMTRGNHESKNMNKIYGFEGEVKAKYTETVFKLFTEVFCNLPLAYVLDGTADPGGKRALVLHGGLFGRDGVTLDELQKIDRHVEPDSGLMAEMLWSDPQKENGIGPSKRGIGVAHGPDVTKRFLDNNNLQLLVRSHEMKEEGYEIEADGRLITVFSAPNYCDTMMNKGSFIRFSSDMKPKITQFSAVAHPPVRAMAYAPNLGMYGLGM